MSVRSAVLGVVGGSLVSAATLGILSPFLKEQEGVVYKAYLDPVGVATACVGSTSNVQMGKTYTKAECDARLAKDIDNAAKVLYANVPAAVTSTLHPKTEAMFISFIFHYGPGGKGVKDGFVYLKSGKNSTMITKLRAGDVVGACSQFPLWNANKLRGIERRNQKSMELCLEGVALSGRKP